MDDLIAFLRARLDERERRANAALPGPWRVDQIGDYTAVVSTSDAMEGAGNVAGMVDATVEYSEPVGVYLAYGAAEHIADNDPARVLAEVDAKRRIIELHQPQERMHPKIDLRYCVTCMDVKSGYPEDWKEEVWPCATLRLLALPYADHPGYREEWRP